MPVVEKEFAREPFNDLSEQGGLHNGRLTSKQKKQYDKLAKESVIKENDW